MEKLHLRVAVPAGIDSHAGDGKSVQNDGDQAGILEFVQRVKALPHAGLRIDDTGVVRVVVQMNVVIVMVLKPAPVQVKTDESGNEDDKGHNVKREVHKKLPLLGGFQGRRAIVRGVIYSFAEMILLFAGEFKSVDRSLLREITENGPLSGVERQPEVTS
jgi:hypothetical protein